MSIQVPNRGVLVVAIASAVTTFAPPEAHAHTVQDSPAAGGLEEVVVMARKRAENLQEVPVSLTALTSSDIVRLDLTSLEKVAAATPSFSVGRASSGSGAQLTLRGIGSSSTSIGLEQSVAVIVDGAYYGQSRIIQEGFFDLDRIEILKGPQALFFGKNATAGVIALQTANPTDEWEFTARNRYEFESEQTQLEAIASGPLTDTLGLRVALRGSKMSGGYYKNIANDHAYTTFDIATNQLATHTAKAADRDAPGEEEALGRVTLRWTPTDRLTATLKVAGDYNDVNNSSWNIRDHRM